MPNRKYLQHPVVLVTLAGTEVEPQSAYFTLLTDQGLPPVMASLAYPLDTPVGAVGDTVTVSLHAETETIRYFTGMVYKLYDEGVLRVLALADGYQKLCDTTVNPAYRKERAKRILQDTLDAAGITETAITCPDVEVKRFSTVRISAARCITLLIKALEEHGHTGLRYFFNEQDVFHFGTGDDTGRNEGEPIVLETAKDIITKGEGQITILPLQIRHSRKVLIDEIEQETVRTDLRVSRHRSRLTLWLKEAHRADGQ